MPRATVPEDTPFDLVARFTHADGVQVIRSDIQDITISTFDNSDGTTDWLDQFTYASADCLTSTTVNAALVNDGRWQEDGDGYNFLWTYDQNMQRLKGGRSYLIEVVLNRSNAGPISQRWTVDVAPLLSRRT